MKLEICVDSLESAVIAAFCGADRIEVCEDLTIGGLTPSKDLVRDIKSTVSLPVFVLIRPRAGNFNYSKNEIDGMIETIKEMKELNVDGLVFGILNKNNQVDVAFCKQLLVASSGLPVTFHRAFDHVEDKEKALEDIINLGFKRVLTTGGQKSAEEGVQNLKKLILQASSRIIIMPGGDVNPQNISSILEKTNAEEIHSSARTADSKGSEKSKICLVKAVQNMKRCLRQDEARKILHLAAM